MALIPTSMDDPRSRVAQDLRPAGLLGGVPVLVPVAALPLALPGPNQRRNPRPTGRGGAWTVAGCNHLALSCAPDGRLGRLLLLAIADTLERRRALEPTETAIGTAGPILLVSSRAVAPLLDAQLIQLLQEACEIRIEGGFGVQSHFGEAPPTSLGELR